MSDERPPNTGYSPVGPDAPAYTFQELEQFHKFFRKLLKESKVGWAIIAAGIAGVFEILHILWLAGWWIYSHWHS